MKHTFYFYSPLAFEKWDWRNPIKQGIGGSETAHIEMALRLAKRGHKVISYGPIPDDCKGDIAKYGGVEWKDLKDANLTQDGIWVISRYPKIADDITVKFTRYSQLNKRQFWLVMQDCYYTDLIKDKKGKERALKFDKFLALCTTHVEETKRLLPFVADRVIRSSNGLKLDILPDVSKIKRDPKRLVYASSPDRGLLSLLKIFKRIHQLDSEVTLHVFYGFDNIKKFVKNSNQSLTYDEETIGNIEKLLAQPGVVWRGRTPQPELYKEWASAGIWAYPTTFTETSCITSMEAQALGAIPVTAPIWALADNVTHGFMIQGDTRTDPLTQMRYAYTITRLANAPEAQEKIRPQMMHMVRESFDYERIVDQYEALADGKNMEFKTTWQ